MIEMSEPTIKEKLLNFKNFFYLFVTVSLFYGIYYVNKNLLRSNKSFSFSLILVVGAVYLTSLSLRGFRYKIIQNTYFKTEKQSLQISLFGVFIAWGLNVFIPGRLGELVRIYISNRYDKIENIDSFNSVIVEKVFDLLTMFSMGIIAFSIIIFNSENLPKNANWYGIILLISLFFAILSLYVLVKGKFLGKIISKIPLIGNLLLKLINNIRGHFISLFQNRQNLMRVILLSFSIWIFDTSTLVLITKHFELEIPFVNLVFISLIGFLSFVFPILPGGTGQFEVTVAGLFVLFGYDFNDGFSVALFDHIGKALTSISVGLICVIILIFREYVHKKK